MDGPAVKSMKVYAVIESVIELPAANLEAFLRSKKFSGSVTVNYNQGGVRTLTTQEHIPISMAELDRILEMNGK